MRIDLNGLDATASYKASASSTWNTIGTLTAYSGFSPNYVALSAVRRGYADNVQFFTIPEPSALVLLAVGGVLVVAVRNRRRN